MSVPATRPPAPTTKPLRRGLAAWVRTPVVDSFKWGVLTRGDVLTAAVAMAGFALFVVAAISAR
jgi:hypothetical protein